MNASKIDSRGRLQINASVTEAGTGMLVHLIFPHTGGKRFSFATLYLEKVGILYSEQKVHKQLNQKKNRLSKISRLYTLFCIV